MANFPPRPANALGGSQFFARLDAKDSPNRDELIANEILRGNFPNFMRQLSSITINENNHSLTYKVTPDYLSIGSDADYVRVPLGADAAQSIANNFGCILPTAKMSDQIWKAAKTKIAPKPLSGQISTFNGKTYSPNQFFKEKLSDTDSFLEYNRQIQEQLTSHKPGDLVAGHKKDLIISKHVSQNPDRASIYGMHNQSGHAIQGNSWVHLKNYRDYSSGIRLVDKQAQLDGKPIDLELILKDKSLASLISNEGPLTNTSYQTKEKPKTSVQGRASLLDRISNYMDKINKEM